VGFALHAVSKVFDGEDGPIGALEGVEFAVAECEFICIVGPSGCGKTTLLRLVAGLIEPTSGEVVFAGKASLNGRHCALVFQEHGMLPWCTVLENVALGLEFAGVAKAERETRARSFIATMGLSSFERCFPHQLSVGMRQRVAIARSFVAESDLLLLDEPFGSLDAQTRLVLQDELLRVWRDHRRTVVHVTHDIDEAIMLADRVLVMSGRPGRIREDIRVPVPRPRDRASLNCAEAAELRRRVWDLLRDEVKANLGVIV